MAHRLLAAVFRAAVVAGTLAALFAKACGLVHPTRLSLSRLLAARANSAGQQEAADAADAAQPSSAEDQPPIKDEQCPVMQEQASLLTETSVELYPVKAEHSARVEAEPSAVAAPQPAGPAAEASLGTMGAHSLLDPSETSFLFTNASFLASTESDGEGSASGSESLAAVDEEAAAGGGGEEQGSPTEAEAEAERALCGGASELLAVALSCGADPGVEMLSHSISGLGALGEEEGLGQGGRPGRRAER